VGSASTRCKVYRMLNDGGRIDSDDERYLRGRGGGRIDLKVFLSRRIKVQICSRMFHLLNSMESCCFDCCVVVVVVVDYFDAEQRFFLCKLAPWIHILNLFVSLNED